MNIGFCCPNEAKVIIGMTQKDYISKKVYKIQSFIDV